MPKYLQTWITIVTTITSLFLLFPSANGCTYSSFPPELGRNFVVEVTDRGRAVAGLQIELSTNPSRDQESRSVKVVVTDAGGVATFAGVKPGEYYVGIKQPAFRQNIEIRVVKKPKPGSHDKVQFDWPGRQALVARKVSGVLSGDVSTGNLAADFKPPLPHRFVAGARLTLANLASAEVVSSTMTEEGGRFDLGNVQPGRYSLLVEKPSQSEVRWRYPNGYLYVEVDSASQIASLDILLSSAICGELGYQNLVLATSVDEAKMEVDPPGLDEGGCSTESAKPNLSLNADARVVGKVEDQSGAMFRKSRVLVLRYGSPTYVEELKTVITDDAGAFDLGTLYKGTYRVLASPHRGFAQPDKLDCSGQAECKLNIVLKANPSDLPYAACPIK